MAKKTNYYGKSSIYTEAFQTLATNIEYSDIDHNLKTIVITSANPSEGKSTVTVNLGRTLSERGAKVLVLDCDLRNPSVSKVTGVETNAGLTNILINDVDPKRVSIVEEQTGMDVILTGPLPPNPTEILRSTKIKEFINRIKAGYDFVLIDSPPVGIITDAAILSTYADGVILVIKHGETKTTEFSQAKTNIEQVGGKILGVVLNQVKMKKRGSNYYNYY